MNLNADFSVWKVCVASRRLFALAVLFAVIGSCIVSASIPDVYASRAIISIDNNDNDPLEKGNILSNLKEMLVSSESNVLSESRVYMKIVQSSEFENGLRTAEVVTEKGEKMNFADYLAKERMPWWSGGERLFAERVEDCVKYEMNTHNDNITVQVELQDAVVACAMVDTIINRLHCYMSEYMVKKAKIAYCNQLAERTKIEADYKDIMKKKAQYADSNFGAERPDVASNIEALQKEADRLTEMRNDAAVKTEMAKMEIERTRPTFIKLVSNHVANNPLHPHWIANFMIWLFYSLTATLLFVLYRKKSELGKKNNVKG